MSNTIRFDTITAYHVKMPMHQPFRISVGTMTEKEAVVLEARSGEFVGWGEAAVDAIPFYTYETAGTALHLAQRVFGPLARSRAWSSPGELAAALAAYRGHSFTKAAFEALAWDITGQRQGRSVASLLGEGLCGMRQWVEGGPSLGIKSEPAELLDAVAAQLDAGMKRIKIKVAPGRDVAFIEAIRRVHPDITLMVDANSAYEPAHMEHLTAWDRYGLLMIEQPFDHDDLYFHAELCRRMATPICLDESIVSPHVCRCAIAMKAADIINIKVGRVAGLTGARQVHDLCAASGVGVWIGNRLGSGIAESTRLAAAALPNAIYPSDIGFSRAYIADELIDPWFETRYGCEFRVPTVPGLGITVDRRKLAKYTLRRIEV